MSRDDDSQGQPSREDAERAMRRLLRDNDLPEPDQILDHDDGGIVCLWHEPKVAVVVDVTEAPPSGSQGIGAADMATGQPGQGERADQEAEVP
jgi:hypothetical protein